MLAWLTRLFGTEPVPEKPRSRPYNCLTIRLMAREDELREKLARGTLTEDEASELRWFDVPVEMPSSYARCVPKDQTNKD